MSGVAIDVRTNSQAADRDLAKIERSLKGIEGSADKAAEAMAGIGAAIAVAAGAAAGLMHLSTVVDQFTNLGNKIALVTGRTTELIVVQKQLLDISNRTRSSLDGTASTYSLLGKAMKNTGVSSQSLLTVTEAVNQSITMMGGSAESAQAALFQLGQGLSSGVLRGEEFNSIMEQAPRLAQALADNLKLSQGQLRAMANEGKLTSDVVFKALLQQSGKINEEFSMMAPTMSQGFLVLKQAANEMTYEMLKGAGVSEKFGKVLVNMADGIREQAQNIGLKTTLFIADIRAMLAVISSITRPIGAALKELGKQLMMAVPKFWFSRTFIGDIQYAFTRTDTEFGRFFVKTRLAFGTLGDTLFTWDGPIEKAIKKMKRLTPTEWLKNGVNSGQLAAFFNVETVYMYSEALTQLADGVKEKTDSMASAYRDWGRDVRASVHSALMYVGLMQDTVLRMKIGFVDPFIKSIAALIRGISGMSIGILNIGRKIEEDLNDSYVGILHALSDAFFAAPRIVAGALQSVLIAIIKFTKSMALMMKNAWQNMFYGLESGAILLLHKLGDVYDRMTGKNKMVEFFHDVVTGARVMAAAALPLLYNFAKEVIQYFFEIWDAVIGHSWWTDTVESVVNTSATLWDDIKRPLGKFRDATIDLFETIWKKVEGMKGWRSTLNSFLGGLKDFSAKATILTASKSIGLGIESMFQFPDSSTVMSNLAGKYLKGITRRKLAYALTPDPTVLQQAMHWFDTFTFGVILKTLSMANKAEKVITRFCALVIAEFKEVWDAVIGHSWWTDTMDGIVDQANSLVSRTKGAFSEFKEMVYKFFRSITGNATIGDKISGNFKGMTKLFGTMADDFRDKMVKAFQVFKENAPDIARTIGTALLAGAALMLPAGKIKVWLVTELVSSFLIAASLISETFAHKVFGTSLVVEIGRMAGKFAGEMVAHMIREIPKILDALFGLFSGFFQGFAGEIPLIGGLIKTLLGATDALGLSGPLGLVGLFFFGNNIAEFLKTFEMLEGPVGYLQDFFKWIKDSVTGQGGGAISQFLYGKLGQTRMIAGIGVLLSSFGAFDSIFGDSFIMKMIANGGLVAALLGGDAAMKKAGDLGYKYALEPIIQGVKELSKRVTLMPSLGADGTLNAMLFGGTGSATPFIAEAQNQVKTALTKVYEKVVDVTSDLLADAKEPVMKLLFGEDPDKTKQKFKDLAVSMANKAKAAFANVRARLAGLNIMSIFTGGASGAASGLAGLGAKIGAFVRSTLASVNNTIRTNTPQNGLLGTLFFGKYGRMALLAIILATVAGFASAADKQTAEAVTKNYGMFDSLKSQIAESFDTHPITTFLGVLAAGMAATAVSLTALAALILPRSMFPVFMSRANSILQIFVNLAKEIGLLFIKMYNGIRTGLVWLFSAPVMSSIKRGFITLTDFIVDRFRRNLGRIKGTAMTMAVAGGATAIAGGSSSDIQGMMLVGALVAQTFMLIPLRVRAAWAVNLLGMRASIAMALRSIGAFAAIGRAAAAAWLIATGPVGWVLVGITALGAALIGIFAQGETFADKLSNTVDGFLRLIGWLDANKTSAQVDMEKKVSHVGDKLGGYQITNGDFSALDFRSLPKGFEKDLGAINDKLAEAVKTGFDEQNQLGEVQNQTLDSIRELTKQRDLKIEQGRMLGIKEVPAILKDLNASRQQEASKWDFIAKWNQRGRSADLRMDIKRLEKVIEKNPGDLVAIKELERLRERGKKDYNVNYVFEDDWIKKMQKLVDDMGDTNANLINDNQTKEEQEDIRNLKKNWQQAVVEYDRYSREAALRTRGFFNGGDANLFGGETSATKAAKINEESSRMALEFLSNKIAAIFERRRQIDEYNEKQSQFEANLSKTSTDGVGPLFTLGKGAGEAFETAADQFAKAAGRMVQMSNSIKESANSQEKLRKYLELRDTQVDFIIRAKHNTDLNTLSTDKLLGKTSSEAGLDVDTAALSSVDIRIRHNLALMAQSVETARINLDKAALIFDPNAEDGGAAAEDAEKQARTELITAQRLFYKQLEELLKGTSMDRIAAMKALKIEIPASYFEADPQEAAAYMEKARQYAEYSRDLADPSVKFSGQGPDGSDMNVFMQKYVAGLKYELDNLAPIANSLNGIVQRMSVMGIDVNQYQAAQLKPNQAQAIIAASEEFRRNKVDMDRPDSRLTPEEVRANVERNGKLMSEVTSIIDSLPKSISQKIEAMSTHGMNMDVSKFMSLPTELTDGLLNAIADMTEYDRRLNAPGLGKEEYEVLSDLIPEANITFKRLADEAMSYGEQLEFINEHLQDAAVTAEEWGRLNIEQRKELFSAARDNRDDTDRYNTTRDPETARKLQKTIRGRNLANQTNAGRSEVRSLYNQMQNLGLEANESVLAMMDSLDFKAIKEKVGKLATAKLNLDELDPAARAAAEGLMKTLGKQIASQYDVATQTFGVEALGQAGVNISEEAYNMVRDEDRKRLDAMAQAIKEQKRIMLDPNVSEATRIAAQNMINDLQTSLAYAAAELSQSRENSPAYQAGQSLASNVFQTMSSGISDFLKGKMKGKDLLHNIVDSFTSSVVDNFVGGMMKAVTGKDGIMSKLLGGVGESVFSLGSSLFGGNTKNEEEFAATAMHEAATAMKDLNFILMEKFGLTNPALGDKDGKGYDPAALRETTGAMEDSIETSNRTLGSIITQGLDKLTGGLFSGLQSLAMMLSAMGGGGGGGGGIFGLIMQGVALYNGMGTGAEGLDMDAMKTDLTGSLQNFDSGLGFNADDYLQGMGSFATGGVIPGTVGTPVPIMAHGGEVILNAAQQNALLNGGGGKTEQLFNLNITGDVSAQTRREIAKLMPQIAAGVSQQQLERGRR